MTKQTQDGGTSRCLDAIGGIAVETTSVKSAKRFFMSSVSRCALSRVANMDRRRLIISVFLLIMAFNDGYMSNRRLYRAYEDSCVSSRASTAIAGIGNS